MGHAKAGAKRVLICGGGVIGASIAYFLGCRGIHAIVIERSGLACAASGKSGGFLALDWCDGSPLEPLARRSFALHASLARDLGADWGYRRLDTYGGFAGAQVKSPERGRSAQLGWLSDSVRVGHKLGSMDTTAQVHPGLFTQSMMEAARTRGAQLRIGTVTGVVMAEHGTHARGVKVDGEIVEGDAVVIAMGPWSMLAADWLPLPAVFGLKGHSLVLETGSKVPPAALFLEYPEPGYGTLSPEVFPRADGTTYVCAISSQGALPVDPAAVAPDAGAIERLRVMCRHLSAVFAEAKVLAAQACHRPVTVDGLPLIGEVPGIAGAYVATGHSVWGILNAPATGEAVASLIAGDVAHAVDLAPFDPARLAPARRPHARNRDAGQMPGRRA